MTKIKFIIAGLLAAAMTLSPAYAEGFLKLGDIKGEATDKDHKDWIPVLTAEDSLSRDTSSSTGSARQRSALTVAPIIITRRMDTTSPLLRQSIIDDQVHKDATIDFGSQVLIMTNVRIVSINGSYSSADMMEEIALVAGSIKWTSKSIDNKGKERPANEAVWSGTQTKR